MFVHLRVHVHVHVHVHTCSIIIQTLMYLFLRFIITAEFKLSYTLQNSQSTVVHAQLHRINSCI